MLTGYGRRTPWHSMSINTPRARAHLKRSTTTAEVHWTHEAQPFSTRRAGRHRAELHDTVEETKPAGLCAQNRSTPRAGAHPHSQQEHAQSSRTFKEGRRSRMTRMRMKRSYRMTSSMRSSQVVKASDSQCRSRNYPGFDPSIFRLSGF